MISSLVSIIVNCHNGEKYLHQALSSIQKQTYKNYEVIFYDNNSIDKSSVIFKNFAYKDKRFKYYKSNKKFPYHQLEMKQLKYPWENI